MDSFSEVCYGNDMKCLQVVQSNAHLKRMMNEGKISIYRGSIHFGHNEREELKLRNQLMKTQFGALTTHNRFGALREEPVSMVTFLEPRKKSEKFTFLQKSIVFTRRAKKLRQKRMKLLLREVYEKYSVPTVQCERNSVLLCRLRFCIAFLKDLRMNVSELRQLCVQPKRICLEAQMDEKQDAQGDQETPIQEKHGNTLNESNRGRSLGIAAQGFSNQMYADLSSAENCGNYIDLTDRFFPIGCHNWSVVHKFNQTLAEYNLPYDFVNKFPDSANGTMFLQYAYWNGDMEVKIMVNSNKFQVGQLQMKWYYGANYEWNFSDIKDNVFVGSQGAHCLVSASASNEGVLYIPFKYYKPKMGTVKRFDDETFLNLGKLSVKVLSPLNCSSSTFNACNFTISIRFINSTFSGMKARNLGTLKLEAQMFSIGEKALKSGVSAALSSVAADLNRDLPPAVNPPMHVVPWSAHSWAVGTNMVQPLNPLRLDCLGQTPHPNESLNGDEMTIANLVNIFGLYDVLKWKSSDVSGALLMSLEAAPLLDITSYQSLTKLPNIVYYLPPVATLATMFNYWRGSIDIRIDVIASQFHTGRLLFCYIPRVDVVPTLDQAKSSPHTIFDLQGESRQFVFNIPYIADKPWWPTRKSGSNIRSPSFMYIFVLNELIPMDNVPNEIELIIYTRGGVDFELSIPVSPRVGTSMFNTFYKIPDSQYAYTKEGYTPLFVGNWRYFENSTKDILRYGNVTDHITQFSALRRRIVYKYDAAKSGRASSTGLKGKGDNIDWYIVGIPIDASDQYAVYAAYFDKYANALAYAESEDNDLAQEYNRDTEYFDWNDGSGVANSTIFFKEVQKTTGFEVVELEAQMDERRSANMGQPMLPLTNSTNSGSVTFGESFGDLKDLCRRYQLYYTVESSVKTLGKNSHMMKIPLLPQGLFRSDTQIPNDVVYNYVRDGIIPIISSGFRFYRGGLRIRFVWLGSLDVMVTLEHRPDEGLRDWNLQITERQKQVYNHGYAMVCQNMRVNNVIEIEVPFYQPGVLGLLNHPNIKPGEQESYHYSLGNLYIGVDSILKTNTLCDFNIFYSFADDMRFSVFQGFPPVFPIPHVVMEAQMGLGSSLKKAMNLPNKVDKVVDDAAATLEKVDKIADAVTNTEENVENIKTSMIDWITREVPGKLKHMMINAFSQIIHCFISPTLKTIVWALVSFLVNIGLLCHDMVDIFQTNVSKLLGWLSKIRDRCGETKRVTDVKLEANMGSESMPDDVRAGLISTVVTSVVALCGNARRIPSNIPDFMSGLWNNVGKFSFTANHMCTFFKNNLTWITRAYKWTIAKVFPDRALAMEISSSTVELKEFCREALLLLDDSNLRKLEIHPKWNLRLYACAARAQAFMIQMMNSDGDIPKTPALIGLIRDVLKRRDELVKSTLSPPIRFEPFVMGIVGEPNAGKSRICQNIGKDMLRSINYKTYDELIYTRTPGNPYWNYLRNQPICLYDDFCAIGSESGLQQAGELFCLKSKAVFNPPQADLKDKMIRYNPLLVFLSANDSHPKLPGVQCHKAFWRRRDLLIKVEKNKAFYRDKGVGLSESPNKFRKEDIANYEHLNFYIASDPSDDKTQYSNRMTYIEIRERFSNDFKTFYENELLCYQQAIQEAFEFFPEDDYEFFDVKDNLEMMKKKIDTINKYRFDHQQEMRVFISESIVEIKDSNNKIIPIIVEMLKVMKQVDSIFVDEVLKKCPHLKDVYNGVRFESNMETIQVCPHTIFDVGMSFERDEDSCVAGHYPSGKFFYASRNTPPIPDQVCEDYCVWKDDNKYAEDMEAWLNDKYSPMRRRELARRKWESLPIYFVRKNLVKTSEVKTTTELSETLDAEIETWLQWSKRILSTMANGLWVTLKYAAKIIALISVSMGLYGFCVNRALPERKDIAIMDHAVKSGAAYHTAYQATTGALDGMYVVNNEILAGAHYSQQDPSTSQSEGQMQASGDYKVFGKVKPEQLKDVAVKMIGNLAKEFENSIIRLIKRNTMFIVAEYNDKMIIGRIVGLCNHTAVMVNHYHDKLSKLDNNAIVYLVGSGFKVPVKYNQIKYRPFNDSSLGIYELPKQIPPFKNLIKHMARQKDHRSVGPLSRLVEPQYGEETILVNPQYCERISNVEIEASNGFDKFYVSDGYKYAYGGRGICGSVLISDSLEHPIYGLHVAGDIGGRVGISEAITYEQFLPFLENSSVHDIIEPNMMEWKEGFMKPRSHISIMGLVPSQFAHRETGKSKVIPTECHGEIFPVYCQPPVLSQNDERISDEPFSPMQEGIDKHGLVTDNFPDEVLEMAYQDLNNVILAKVIPVRGCVSKLTKEVAVIGDRNVDGFDKLDLNTSEGFPFTSMRPPGMKSKKWMLDLEVDIAGNYTYNGCDPMLREVMKIKKQQRLRRELPFTVFVDCLKDRKILNEKIKKPGSVRIFSISPLDYTIQCRQYFMDFSVSYQNAMFDVEHAVGIDVNSFGWTELATRLLNNSPHIVTADYSGFGPSLNLACCKKALQIIRNWYDYHGDNRQSDLMREMIGYEMMYSVHLSFSTFYRTLCGLPSGNPLTVILNSLVNCLYIRASWIMVMRDLCKNDRLDSTCNYTLDSFHKNCVMFVYGDDLIMSVKERAVKYFNCETIANVLNRFKIVVKNASKGNEIVCYSTLLNPETTFLKNQFLVHPKRHGLFLAALDKRSVEDTLNYTFKEWEHHLRKISIDASDACIRSAYGHGEKYFEYVRQKVIDYWRQRREIILTPAWDAIDDQNFCF